MILSNPIVEREVEAHFLPVQELLGEFLRQQPLDDPLALAVPLLEIDRQLIEQLRQIQPQEWNAYLDGICHAREILPEQPSLQIDPLKYLQEAQLRCLNRHGRRAVQDRLNILQRDIFEKVGGRLIGKKPPVSQKQLVGAFTGDQNLQAVLRRHSRQQERSD